VAKGATGLLMLAFAARSLWHAAGGWDAANLPYWTAI